MFPGTHILAIPSAAGRRTDLETSSKQVEKVKTKAETIAEQGYERHEAQDISNALIAAEQRIGEILLAIPKQSGGDRKSEDFKNGHNAKFEKTKKEVASDMGYSHNDVRDYQQMAKHPEVVQRVIEDALAIRCICQMDI